jgi:hypothetical protein
MPCEARCSDSHNSYLFEYGNYFGHAFEPEGTLVLHTRQLFDEEAPAAPEYFPAAQLMQSFEPTEPNVVEYFPAEQSEHFVAPVKAEYLPAEQLMHADPDLYLPIGQLNEGAVAGADAGADADAGASAGTRAGADTGAFTGTSIGDEAGADVGVDTGTDTGAGAGKGAEDVSNVKRNAALAVDDLPAAHIEHNMEPIALEYWPAAQGVQLVRS